MASKQPKQPKKQKNQCAKPKAKAPKQPKPSRALLPCTSAACRYAEALLYPEHALSDVSLPSGALALPSWKVRTVATLVWSTGTVGYGYVTVAPFATLLSGTASNGLIATDAAYTGSAISATPTTGLTSRFITSPVSALGASKFRLVTAGMVTQCTTPGLDRGGLMTSVVSQGHDTLTGIACNLLPGWGQASNQAFGTEALYHKSVFGPPVTNSELEFGTPTGIHSWAVVATSASPQTFISTFVAYYELIGYTNADLTPSESAPQQAAVISSVVSDAINGNISHAPLSEGFFRGVSASLKHAMANVGFALGTAAPYAAASAASLAFTRQGRIAYN